MIQAFKTVENGLVKCDRLDEKGSWVNLVAPTEAELQQVSAETGILIDFLRAPLDEEERSRIETDDGQILIIINVPVERSNHTEPPFDTLPLGIILNENQIFTVCLENNKVIDEFLNYRAKFFYTHKKTRFLLQILYKTATSYLRYLKIIDKLTSDIERELHRSMKNEELIKLLNLEKSLVYFTTSLRSNGIVLEKLMRSQLVRIKDDEDPDTQIASQILRMYPEDEDLLEDVITENKQALEMGEIHSNILSGMMDAFASVISNNLNIVMKFLASITIILSLPTMVASFYGMNVALPFQRSPHAFGILLLVSVVLSLAGAFIFKKKRML